MTSACSHFCEDDEEFAACTRSQQHDYRNSHSRLSGISAWGRLNKIFDAVLRLIAILVIGYVVGSYYLRMISGVNTSTVLSCGNSAPEARSLGCVLDVISRTWVHPLCYDEQITSDFVAQNWTWYLTQKDAAGKATSHAIPPTQLQHTLEDDDANVMVSAKYHLWHCSYAWQKFHRAVLERGRVDTYLANYQHTKHCSHVGLDTLSLGSLDSITTQFTVKFTACVPLGS